MALLDSAPPPDFSFSADSTVVDLADLVHKVPVVENVISTSVPALEIFQCFHILRDRARKEEIFVIFPTIHYKRQDD